jgi:hypothetical protein
MIIRTSFFRRLQRRGAVVLLCAASLIVVTEAQAGDREDKIAASADTPDAVKHGELVFHGNYCGVGNRKGADPIDALDEACMHHDACTPTGKIQSCACNARLAEEALAITRDPAQPAELQALASLTATAATAGMVMCAPAALVSPEPVAHVAPTPVAPAASVEPADSVGPATSVAPVSSVAPSPSTAVVPAAPVSLEPPISETPSRRSLP